MALLPIARYSTVRTGDVETPARRPFLARPHTAAPGGRPSAILSLLAGAAWCCIACTAASAADPAGATGVVTGSVSSAEDGKPLGGALVKVAGTGLSGVTDADGRFRIEGVPAGTRYLEATHPAFESAIASVEVAAGSDATSAVMLAPLPEASTIVVQERLVRAGERGVMAERARSAGATDRMGSQEIKQQGTASDAGAVASRLPAVTIADGKFAYVRGLGERYSQTLVNRSTLPSPEPDQRVVPLDLFPANVIDTLVVAKTYTPDLPGEFAGGSVQIELLDVPADSFFQVGATLKYRDGTTFKPFNAYPGGKYDMLGFDDGTRELPGGIPGNQVRGGSSGLSDEQIQAAGRSFPNTWRQSTQTALPDHRVSSSFGTRYAVGDEGAVGVVGAFNWANKYLRVDDETFSVLTNAGTETAPRPLVLHTYALDSSTFEAEMSGVVNLTFEPNPVQRVSFCNFVTQSATDRARLQEGFDGTNQRLLLVTQYKWVERLLYNGQLAGEHLLAGDTVLQWRGGYALSTRDEPDNRQTRYDLRYENVGYALEDIPGSGRRDFYYLYENTYSGAADYAVPFNPFGVEGDEAREGAAPEGKERLVPDQKVQIGAAYNLRDRDFQARTFRYTQATTQGRPVDEYGQPIDLTRPPEDLFVDENIYRDGFVLKEQTQPTDNYTAVHNLWAGYGMADVRLVRSVRVQTGVRYEFSDYDVTTFELFGNPPKEIVAELEEDAFMPAMNLSWEFVDDMQLRLGASRTVSRPEFRELAAFEYTDVEGGYTSVGNPDLRSATLNNLDLRWEWFPDHGSGDVVSAGVFYKYFEDPIEKVFRSTASEAKTSWVNAKSAELMGAELEVRKDLGVLWRGLENFSVKTNFAWITSEVEVPPSDPLFSQTNSSRRLQGQPDYTFNTGLFYRNDELGLSMGVLANTFGERISSVGTNGLDDEVERPRWNLELTVSKKIGGGTLRLSFENLLDDDYKFTQNDITTRKYTTGMAGALSYSLSF